MEVGGGGVSVGIKEVSVGATGLAGASVGPTDAAEAPQAESRTAIMISGEKRRWRVSMARSKMSVKPASAFERASRQAGHDLPFGEQVENNRWKCRKSYKSRHQVQLHAILPLELHGAKR